MANGRLETTAVLSNDVLESPPSLQNFKFQHLVVNNAGFQTYNFDKFGLEGVFGPCIRLALIGVLYYSNI
jgi:hypothetical protein